jgi:hypothetical protein
MWRGDVETRRLSTSHSLWAYLCTSVGPVHLYRETVSQHLLPVAPLPPLSMMTSAMDPNHGVIAPHESCTGVGGCGFFSPLSFPLFWVPQKAPIEKLRDGRHFVNRHNNQPKVSCSGGGGVMVMRCDWSGMHGEELFLLFGVANGATKKGRNEPGLGLSGRP